MQTDLRAGVGIDRMRPVLHAVLCAALLASCGDDAGREGSGPFVDASFDPVGAGDASARGQVDAGSSSAAGNEAGLPGEVRADAAVEASPDAALPSVPGCDLSGIWIARQNTESIAIGQPQYANTWAYYELAQAGDELTVTRHFDCGIEVRGTVRVRIPPETARALMTRNVQTGRKGRVAATGDGQCSLALETHWAVRGLSEADYTPSPRNADLPLAAVQSTQPLPLSEQPERTEDWDEDGQPGITWLVNGIVNGERYTVQRNWTRYFTAPNYMIPAGSDYADVVLRAEFDVEEVVLNVQGLNQLSQVNTRAEHTLTMRYLGRDKSDPRAAALFGADDFATCTKVRLALPARAALR